MFTQSLKEPAFEQLVTSLQGALRPDEINCGIKVILKKKKCPFLLLMQKCQHKKSTTFKILLKIRCTFIHPPLRNFRKCREYIYIYFLIVKSCVNAIASAPLTT